MNERVVYTATLNDLASGPLRKLGRRGQRTFMRLDRAQDKMHRGSMRAKQGLGKLAGGLQSLAGLAAAAFATDQIIQFGRAIFETGAKFQKFEAVLTNTLGDQSAAKGAIQLISDFAATTPFQVDQLTDSFVKLANRGFVPTEGELRSLGDLASSTGKEFDQLVEAMLDAQTGEFERLKEFGVTARSEGDRVTFSFKGQQTQVEKTDEAIRDYLLSLGQMDGVSGTMGAISQTWAGMASNIEDTATQIKNNLAQAFGGTITSALEGTSDAANRFNEFITYMRGNGEALKRVFAPLQPIFDAVGAGLREIGESLGLVSDNSMTTQGTMTGLGNVLHFLTPLWKGLAKLISFNAKVLSAFIGFVGDLIKQLWNGAMAVTRFGAGAIEVFRQLRDEGAQIFGGLGNLIDGVFTRNPAKIAAGLAQLQASGSNVSEAFARGANSVKMPDLDFGFAAPDNEGERQANLAALDAARTRIAASAGMPQGGGGTAGAAGSAAVAGRVRGAVEGSRASRSLTISIEKLVGIEALNTTNVKQGGQRAADELKRLLLTMLNDVSIANA